MNFPIGGGFNHIEPEGIKATTTNFYTKIESPKRAANLQVNSREQAENQLQAPTKALRYRINPDCIDERLALTLCATEYLSNKYQLSPEDSVNHTHNGRIAFSIKVPQDEDTQIFFEYLPTFVLIENNGEKEIRIYQSFEHLKAEMPVNYTDQALESQLRSSLTMKLEFPAAFKESKTITSFIRNIISEYENQHEPMPTDRTAFEHFRQNLIKQALAQNAQKRSQQTFKLIGVLTQEPYRIQESHRYGLLKRKLDSEPNFITLYFNEIENADRVTPATGEDIYALPKSIFQRALSTGDTARVFLPDFI